MKSEDEYTKKHNFVEKGAPVSNQSMTIANIDEPTEHDAKVGDAPHGVGDKPASDVQVAQPRHTFRIIFRWEDVNRPDLEKEMNEDKTVYCVDKELKSQKEIDERNVSSLLDKIPKNETLYTAQ